jgi:hypothetical protein
MSLSIDHDRRTRALRPDQDDDQFSGSKLIGIIRVGAVLTALAGIGCLAAAFALNEWRTALAGSTLVIVAVVAGSVCTVNALIADRQEFYRRGKLDGWMQGWRGQEPTADDPLLRR